MKRFCIINLDRLRDAELRDSQPLGCEVLEERYAPTCFYTEKGQAIEELFRLQRRCPKEDFYLFEATQRVVRSLANPDALHVEEVCGLEGD